MAIKEHYGEAVQMGLMVRLNLFSILHFRGLDHRIMHPPDPNAMDNAIIAWADGHASKKKMSAFYLGQTPADRFFDLE
jgi:prepilin-type processing-associated H-X9-DG protein